MTGYLAALAAREFGAVSANHPAGVEGFRSSVMPRRVVAYEPWAMPAVTEVETAARHPREAPEGATEVRDARRAALARRGATAPDAPAAIQPAAPGAPRAPREVALADAMPLLAVSRENDATPTRTTVSAFSSGTAPAQPVAAPAPRARSDAPAAESRRTSVEPARPPTQDGDARSTPGGPVAPVTPARRMPVPVVVTPRRADARVEAPARLRGAEPNEAPPPVMVTIGRIEVRAVPAPAVARPVRAAPSTMSLEDYLHERSRGLR
jgi:hypothetical protein